MNLPAIECTGAAARRDTPLAGVADMTDRATGAALALLTGGIAPASVGAAISDWLLHLAQSPGRQALLGLEAMGTAALFADYMRRSLLSPESAEPCIAPPPEDSRFADPAWQAPPYSFFAQGFLLAQHWWDAACTGIGGVTPRHEEQVRFIVRQMLDSVAPSNFIATNPQIRQRIAETGGQCLADGARQMAEDLHLRLVHQATPDQARFRPGREVAVTPGQVVYRNHLIELIQYRPTTDRVHPEPILFVPAWILKYYILDLDPARSMVRYLVDQGHSVFMISWRNPGADDRNLTLDDYRRMGVMDALDAIGSIVGDAKVHAVGYCLGGTLLSIAAAAMARDGDDRLAGLTLFAAQTDFSEPGELALFIDPAQVHFLENLMWSQGFLDSRQMGGAFQLLRSNELLWSRIIHQYRMGEAEAPTPVTAWSHDGTRLPQAMHSAYLRRLFLNNELAEGRYEVDGRPVSLDDLRVPVFVVGAEEDHVAPWQSVFRIHRLTETEVTFLLTGGDHVSGIVPDPAQAGAHYRIRTRPTDQRPLDPERWLADAPVQEGPWWPVWHRWLADRSGPPRSDPPPIGSPLQDRPSLGPAPGRYVLMP